MKTYSFKLFELLELEAELVGVINQETGEQVFKGWESNAERIATRTKLSVKELKTLQQLMRKMNDADENS